MESDAYPFGREFRLKILSLCLDPGWMAKYGTSIVLPEYFEQDDEETVATAILEYYERFGYVPSDPDDIVVLCGGEYEELVYDVYEDDRDMKLSGEVAIQFAKEQAAKIAILDSVEDVKVGNISRAIERMGTALAIGNDLSSVGIDVIRDINDWLYSLWTEKVCTGWYHIDSLLEGGLSPGELGLVMSPTNRGKTMALINIGVGAAGIGSGKNVVHVTHELNAELTAKRYAARILFRFPKYGDDLEKYKTDLQDTARKLIPGKLRVIDCTGRTSLADVKGRLDRLKLEGYEFDLIIDDYPDLLAPDKYYNQRRFELSGIYTSLRQLAADYGVPVWAATQSNRSSFSKEVITLSDIAEDIGKANIADVIIALCQTNEELKTDACRLFMAKVRDGMRGMMYSAKYFGESQAIVTTGISKKRNDKNV